MPEEVLSCSSYEGVKMDVLTASSPLEVVLVGMRLIDRWGQGQIVRHEQKILMI